MSQRRLASGGWHDQVCGLESSPRLENEIRLEGSMTRGRRLARRLTTVQARDDRGLGSGRGIKWMDSRGEKDGIGWIKEGEGGIKASLIHSDIY